MRPARLGDAAWILELRNDRESRRWSRDPTVIALEPYAAWFAEHVDEYHVQRPTGYVRIEPDGRVSLIVGPQWRGRGRGLALLTSALGTERYQAEIHRQHTASLVTFLRAGFVPVRLKGDWLDVERAPK